MSKNKKWNNYLIIGFILIVLVIAFNPNLLKSVGLGAIVPADDNGYPRGYDVVSGGTYTPLARNLNEVEQIQYQGLIDSLYQANRYLYKGYCIVEKTPVEYKAGQTVSASFSIFPPQNRYEIIYVSGTNNVKRPNPFLKIDNERIEPTRVVFGTSGCNGDNESGDLVKVLNNFYGVKVSSDTLAGGKNALFLNFVVPEKFVGNKSIELWIDYCINGVNSPATVCDSREVVKILNWNVEIKSSTVVSPTQPPSQPEFDFGTWFNSILTSIADFFSGLRTYLGLGSVFGNLGSITGSSQSYVNQSNSYTVSLDSNVNPQPNYSSGSQVVLMAQTRVIDSSGNFVFTSPQTSLVSKNYSYSFNWTPTSTGKYAIVSVILEKHATFNTNTGVWSSWSNQSVTGQEQLGLTINSIGAPLTQPTFDVGQYFSGLINGILSFFRGLFGG